MNNEVLAVLRYAGAPDVLPTTKRYTSSKEIILNCFDILNPMDGKCLPVTALRTHSSLHHKYGTIVDVQKEADEIHEIAFEHTRGTSFGHFTRVRPHVNDGMIDGQRPSQASHREGPFTQFVLPSRPSFTPSSSLSMDNESSIISNEYDHEHSLSLDITHGNNVQLIWNHQGRTSHPIHIHGYKFVVGE